MKAEFTYHEKDLSLNFNRRALSKGRIYLDVSYHDKDEAKALGARWHAYPPSKRQQDSPAGFWYIPPGRSLSPFARWLQITNPKFYEFQDAIAPSPRGKNPAAVALGSLGGRAGGHKGGLARAAKLTPERRSEIAFLGALAKKANAAARRKKAEENEDTEGEWVDLEFIPARNGN